MHGGVSFGGGVGGGVGVGFGVGGGVGGGVGTLSIRTAKTVCLASGLRWNFTSGPANKCSAIEIRKPYSRKERARCAFDGGGDFG